MTDEARAVRAAYARLWRKRNPGKQKEYTTRYWEKKAAELNKKPNNDKKA